jgi:hypothetical protein
VAWYALGSLMGKLHAAVKRLSSPVLRELEVRGEGLVERWCGLEDWAPRAPRSLHRPLPSRSHRARSGEVAS